MAHSIYFYRGVQLSTLKFLLRFTKQTMFWGQIKAQNSPRSNFLKIQLRSICNSKIVLYLFAHAITATSKEEHAFRILERPTTCVSK